MAFPEYSSKNWTDLMCNYYSKEAHKSYDVFQH